MSTPNAKAPTNKVFHFPKGDTMQADETNQDAATPVAARKSRSATAKTAGAAKKPAAKKAAAVKPTEKATKAQAKSTKAAKPAKAAAESTPAATKPAKTDTKKAAAPAVDKTAQDKKRKTPKVAKVAKVEKVVRDSFTMPKSDYAKIAALKQKCLDEGVHVKKSELLRAGLLLLEGASAKRLVAAIGELETVKTGRPAQS